LLDRADHGQAVGSHSGKLIRREGGGIERRDGSLHSRRESDARGLASGSVIASGIDGVPERGARGRESGLQGSASLVGRSPVDVTLEPAVLDLALAELVPVPDPDA
jgi:hypothetical protein